MSKKKHKEPILPTLVEDGNHKNRLKVDDEVYCFDGKSVMEKTTVVEVDKKAKTAKLANQVICSRYPDSTGSYRKMGMGATEYQIKKWSEEAEILVKAHKAKRRLSVSVMQVKSQILDHPLNILAADPVILKKLIDIDESINKILKR